MSRVYSALTGTGRSAAPTPESPDDGFWANDDESSFIEIGGPTGPLFSTPQPPAVTPPPAATLKVAPEVKAADPAPEPTRPILRLAQPPAAAAPTYLSVRFHDVVIRPAHVTPGGPDAGLVAYHFPDHVVSGEYRVLRDEIRQQLPEATSRVLMFSSAVPEAGTTTVLLNLAVTLANEGKTRVLVVDANVNRPAVAAKLALKSAPGLCEVLAHQVPLAWAVQPSVVPNLQVLAAGDATDATPAAVCRDLPKLLSQLRQWYDVVLVDGGVWGTMAERDAACPAADAVYLVTRDGDVDRPEFGNMRGWVKELGGLLRGYVATRA